VLTGFTCGIGFLILLGDPRHRDLPDRMVGTLVIKP
jgi:hypothetical protein